MRIVVRTFSDFSQCTRLCPKYIKCCFQNLRNGRDDENGSKQTTFGFDNEKKMSKIFFEIELFYILEIKCTRKKKVQ